MIRRSARNDTQNPAGQVKLKTLGDIIDKTKKQMEIEEITEAVWPYPPKAATTDEYNRGYADGLLDGKKEGFKEGLAWALGK